MTASYFRKASPRFQHVFTHAETQGAGTPGRGRGGASTIFSRDETCPVSTGGGTRRVQSVREGGGGRRLNDLLAVDVLGRLDENLREGGCTLTENRHVTPPPSY